MTRDAELPSAIERAARVLGPLASFDEPIGRRTTYRVGGTAALFCVVEDFDALERVVDAVSATGVEVLVLGKGSNLLISDSGYRGLCVSLGAGFEEVEIDDQRAAIEAGGAVAYPVLARKAAAAGLRGMEWAVGVPGSVGGAVRMNAGGHGAETAERLVCAHVVGLRDCSNRVLTPRELNLGYRQSILDAEDLVVSATYFFDPGDPEEAMEEIASIVRWRYEHQPGGRNAGSVFQNPAGDAAGRIIEAAGLKGLRRGTAEVSQKHANFIQVDEDGRADDVYALICEVRSLVSARLGIELRPEVRLCGFSVAA